MLSYSTLKRGQCAERDTHTEGLALRVHRALGSLDRAEQCTDDDGGLICIHMYTVMQRWLGNCPNNLSATIKR